MLKIVKVILSLLLFTGAAFAETGTLVLNDGSTVVGEIISMEGGIYTLQTETLGTLKIDQSRVKSIQMNREKPAAADTAAGSGVSVKPEDIQKMQQNLAENQEIMKIIESLQEDPSVQSLLNDPEIMSAINAGDIGKLMTNPKFQEFMNNSKVKEIQQKVKQ